MSSSLSDYISGSSLLLSDRRQPLIKTNSIRIKQSLKRKSGIYLLEPEPGVRIDLQVWNRELLFLGTVPIFEQYLGFISDNTHKKTKTLWVSFLHIT